MHTPLAIAFVAAAVTLGASTAHAGGVSWSIGINTPVVGTVISNGHGYAPGYAPRYEPVYRGPVPVYRTAPAVVYAPPAVYAPAPVAYYRPAPVVYLRHDREWRHHPHWEGRGWHHDR